MPALLALTYVGRGARFSGSFVRIFYDRDCLVVIADRAIHIAGVGTCLAYGSVLHLLSPWLFGGFCGECLFFGGWGGVGGGRGWIIELRRIAVEFRN